MKKPALLLVLLLICGLYAQNTAISEKTVAEISLSDVVEIGNRNAAQMWGEVFPAEPIPYYGPDDEIIAYHLNYSLKGAFPDKDLLKIQCDEALMTNDRDSASGAGDFGNIVIGAQPYMPVFLQYSQSLSDQFIYGRQLERAALEAFPAGYTEGKIYYLGLVHVWHQISFENTNKYINLRPSVKVISEEEFTNLKAEIPYVWDRNSYDDEWQQFLVNGETMSRSEVWIEGEDKMPFYEWSYGCTPTSGAMLMAWWDHHKGMGRLISNHYERGDHVEHDRDYHVPTIQQEMASAMGTDDTGTTYLGDVIDAYYQVVENHGYRCVCDGLWAPHHTDTTLFEGIQYQINQGIPCSVGIWGHTIVGVGYLTSPRGVLIHDPNDSVVKFIHKSWLWDYFYVYVYDDSGNNGVFLEITSPNGGTEYANNGPSETLWSGSVEEIAWEGSHPNATATLQYSLDGGGHWAIITSGTENDGSYRWLVPELDPANFPDGITHQARIRIKIYDNNDELLAADGSYGNFHIIPNGQFIELQPNVSEGLGVSPYFMKVHPQQDAWGVVSVTSNEPEQLWSVELFDDQFPSEFENSVIISEAPVRNNYLVIDKRVAEDKTYGLALRQFNPDAVNLTSSVRFSNTNESINLGINELIWYVNGQAKVWDIWLEPGTHYFQMDMVNENADLDFALFKSGGAGFFSRQDALIASDHIGAGVRESFQYTIETAGYYGVCVSSCLNNGTNFTILVSDASIWVGDISGNWYTAQNWLPQFVPGANHAVQIPSGCTYYPVISASLAPQYTQCKNLVIKAGAMLTVEARNFEVVGDMQTFGTLKLMNSSSEFLVSGSIIWDDGSTLIMGNPDATLLCYRDWTVKAGSYFSGLYRGKVKLISLYDSYIKINSDAFHFPGLVIDKSNGAEAVFSSLSTQDLVVEKDLEIMANSVFKSTSDRSIVIKQSLSNLGSFQFDAGTVKLLGEFGSVSCSAGSYFYNLEINTQRFTTLYSDVHIKGSFFLNSGGFVTNNHTMYVGKNWRNNMGPGGFQKASSTVVFNGSGISQCFGELFANLVIDSPDCQLSFAEGESTIDHYTWVNGLLSMRGGNLTINDMPGYGIYGNYLINDGTLNIHQDASQPVDLLGTYFIATGTMNIYGGSSPSSWANADDLSLTMRGGVLDFKDVSILIAPSASTTLDVDLTGGVIRTARDLTVSRDDFNPEGGSFELYGSTAASVSITAPSAIPTLIINKDGRNEGSGAAGKSNPERTSYISLLTNLELSSDLIISGGTFDLMGKTVAVGNDLEVYGKLKMVSASDLLQVQGSVYWYEGSSSEISNGVIECYRDWNFWGGTASLTGSNTSVFKGDSNSLIYTVGNQYFANVSFAKTSSTYQENLVTIDSDMQVNGNLTISERSRMILSGSDVLIGGTFIHQGSAAQLVPEGNTVTCNDLDIYGHLMVDGGVFTVQDDFYQRTGSQLSVEAGSFVLSAPYTGTYQSFAGDTVINGGSFEVSNDGIQFGASSSFLISGGTLKLGWGLRALTPDSFMQTTGTIEFIGTRTASIELAAGNYLHNVVLSKTGSGTLSLGTDTTLNNLTINSGTMLVNHHSLSVNGNVNISGGALNVAFSDDIVYVNGNWTNSRGSAGFIEGNGTVSFMGSGYSLITSNETFNILQIDKSLELGVGAALSANSYEFITGGLSLRDSSILNTPADGFVLPMGSALRCSWGTAPTINLYGNFVDYNMVIDGNNGFYCGNSIANVLGTGNRQIEASVLKFNDLNINLSGANCHINNYSPEFTGNVHLQSGTLSGDYGSIYTFHQGLDTSPGTSLALAGGALTFTGGENAGLSIGGASDYGSLTINKDAGSAVTLGSALIMPASSTLNVSQGSLQLASQVLSAGGDVNIGNNAEILVNASAQLLMQGSNLLNVNSGGKLSALGSSGQPALISRSGAFYYGLNVYSGGTIAAEHAIFEYMDYAGVNINSGAIVDPAHSFTNCTFQSGSYGGTLLSVNNEQFISITDAVFPSNTWSGMGNVSKNADSGSVSFVNASGAFAGAAFESDPWQRINWNSQNPSIGVNQSSLSFGNVFIPMSEYRSFTITNSGSGSLAGTISLPDDFTANIYRNDTPAANGKADEPQRTSSLDFLALPGTTLEVQVGFLPTQPISYNSTLVITHNAGGAPINITLSGNGMGAQITVNPTQIIKGILPEGSHTETLSVTDSGNTALSYYGTIEYPTRSRAVIMSESFETAFPPSGWSTAVVQQVGTAGVWSRATSTYHPGGSTPQDGQYLAIFNSWTCSTGNQTRLQSGYLDFSGYSSISLSFWMLHDTAYPASNDRIQVQIFSGQTWQNVGDPIERTQLPEGWRQHTVSLSAYANQNYLQIGLLGISQYGNDLNIDNVVVTGSNPPTGWVFFNGQASSVSGMISPGMTDQHQLNISTNGMEPGTYQAEVHIASNDPITSVKVVPITVSVGSPGLSVNPSFLNYPLMEVGSESIFGLTLTNSGSIHLNGSITVPAGYYIQPATRANDVFLTSSQTGGRWSDSEQFILAPGELGSFVVRFAPTAVQVYNGNIVITTDHTGLINVPVTGSAGIVPVVTSGGVSDLSSTSATLYGSITDAGGMTITSKGFYFGSDPDPREYGEILYSESIGNSFTLPLTGLDSGTQYFYCAFANNAMGTGVGEVYLFNTPSPELNVSTTSLPDFGSVTVNTASPAQSFTLDGSAILGDVIISVPTGFRLSVADARTDLPRSDNQIIISPSGGDIAQTTIDVWFQPIEVAPYSGMISISTEGLEDQTITVSGTGVSLPVVTTSAVSDITTSSAVAGGNVTSDGGWQILSKGVCWSLLPNPDISHDHSTDGSGTGAFSSSISPLTPDSSYYLRAYAIYATGTVYGNEITFVTAVEAPASAPDGVTIQINGDYIVLTWDPVPHATSYKVLSSDTPGGAFEEDYRGVFGDCSWTALITDNVRFYQVKAVGGSSSRFVYVPAGTFTMGRTTGTGFADELPSHSVTLSAFYMGKTEVTQKEWTDTMGSNPAAGFGVGDQFPVYNVSWYSVIKYCNLRSLAEGLTPAYSILGSTNPSTWGDVPYEFNPNWDSVICNWSADGYRLPTEAEWEYAARSASNLPDYLYAGSDEIGSVAWYYLNSPSGSKAVAGKTSNALGIYDLSGNINELCWDLAGAYSGDASENPTGPTVGSERIRRGGFWNADATYSRVANRDSSYPFVTNEFLGFRLCRSSQNRQGPLK